MLKSEFIPKRKDYTPDLFNRNKYDYISYYDLVRLFQSDKFDTTHSNDYTKLYYDTKRVRYYCVDAKKQKHYLKIAPTLLYNEKERDSYGTFINIYPSEIVVLKKYFTDEIVGFTQYIMAKFCILFKDKKFKCITEFEQFAYDNDIPLTYHQDTSMYYGSELRFYYWHTGVFDVWAHEIIRYKLTAKMLRNMNDIIEDFIPRYCFMFGIRNDTLLEGYYRHLMKNNSLFLMKLEHEYNKIIESMKDFVYNNPQRERYEEIIAFRKARKTRPL